MKCCLVRNRLLTRVQSQRHFGCRRCVMCTYSLAKAHVRRRLAARVFSVRSPSAASAALATLVASKRVFNVPSQIRATPRLVQSSRRRALFGIETRLQVPFRKAVSHAETRRTRPTGLPWLPPAMHGNTLRTLWRVLPYRLTRQRLLSPTTTPSARDTVPAEGATWRQARRRR